MSEDTSNDVRHPYTPDELLDEIIKQAQWAKSVPLVHSVAPGEPYHPRALVEFGEFAVYPRFTVVKS